MEQDRLISDVVISLFKRWNDLEETKAELPVNDEYQNEFEIGRTFQINCEQRFLNDLIFRVKYEQTAAIPSDQPEPEPITRPIIIHPATGTEPRLLH